MNGQDESADSEGRAARLWYEHFERRRQESGPPPGRQRLARWLILAAAVALLVVGLRLRGQRMQEVMSPAGPRDWASLFSRELQLDDSTGAAFFPLWEEWRRGSTARRSERAALLKDLAELSAQHSDLNAEQERLLGRLRDLESQELEGRGRLLDQVRARLGLWQAARLQVLLEETPR